MSNEIQVGMKFGSFYASTDSLGKKYKSEDDFDAQKSHIKYYDNEKNLVATSQKDLVGGNVLFSIKDHSTGRTYESSRLLDKNSCITNDVKFDRIEYTNYYAVDTNGNGIVDEGEIFEKQNRHRQADWLF